MSSRNQLRPSLLSALAATVLLTATAGVASPAVAADPAAGADPAANTAVAAPAASADPAAVSAPATLSPLHQEIRSILQEQQAEVEALALRIAQERDPHQLLQLQRAVEAAKQQAQVGVLEAQLRHARAGGAAETVAALETALQQVLHPEVSAKPQPRPAPQQGNTHR